MSDGISGRGGGGQLEYVAQLLSRCFFHNFRGASTIQCYAHNFSGSVVLCLYLL